MAQRSQFHERESDTAPKFYLPAGISLPSDDSQVTRLWASLFEHQVEPPK